MKLFTKQLCWISWFNSLLAPLRVWQLFVCFICGNYVFLVVVVVNHSKASPRYFASSFAPKNQKLHPFIRHIPIENPFHPFANLHANIMIKAILVFNNHGKPRLSKFYQYFVSLIAIQSIKPWKFIDQYLFPEWGYATADH